MGILSFLKMVLQACMINPNKFPRNNPSKKPPRPVFILLVFFSEVWFSIRLSFGFMR
jgi:hypothetical protein